MEAAIVFESKLDWRRPGMIPVRRRVMTENDERHPIPPSVADQQRSPGDVADIGKIQIRTTVEPGSPFWRPRSLREGIGPFRYVWWNSFYAIMEFLNRKLARDPNRKVSWDKWPPHLGLLSRTAVSLAAAGADIVAPSDMMDGRVGAIRDHLDDAGLEQVPILSYAAKVASAFYGAFSAKPPIRRRSSVTGEPVGSMDANLREAMREINQDIAEGADMILMKPAMPYLDVIRAARERLDVPIGAYQVSGEYAMLQAAFAKGWLDRDRAILESLISIRRAGADFTVTYFAREAARLLAD